MGVNGICLPIISVWLHRQIDGKFQFVTLVTCLRSPSKYASICVVCEPICICGGFLRWIYEAIVKSVSIVVDKIWNSAEFKN